MIRADSLRSARLLWSPNSSPCLYAPGGDPPEPPERLHRYATGKSGSLSCCPILADIAAALNQRAANPRRAITSTSVHPTRRKPTTAERSCRACVLRLRMRLSRLSSERAQLAAGGLGGATAFRIMRWRLRFSRDLLDLHVLHTIVRTRILEQELAKREAACHMLRAATPTDRRSNHEPMCPSSRAPGQSRAPAGGSKGMLQTGEGEREREMNGILRNGKAQTSIQNPGTTPCHLFPRLAHPPTSPPLPPFLPSSSNPKLPHGRKTAHPPASG